MFTYLIKRFLQSMGFILLAWFGVYTLMVVIAPPASATLTRPDGRTVRRVPQELADPSTKAFEPWPLNFFLWLFDPRQPQEADPGTFGTFTGNATGHEDAPLPGIDVGIGDLRLRGSGLLTGNFGRSTVVQPGEEVGSMLVDKWGRTVMLVVLSLILSVAVSIPLGMFAATRYRTSMDHLLTFLSFLGFCIPAFSLGILLVLLTAVGPSIMRFSLGWEWLPNLPAGGVSDMERENDLVNLVYHLVLPVTTLALPQIAWLSRHMRFAMLEVLRLDYIRTARAKGLSDSKVVLKHALRNALLPTITSVGFIVPLLFSAAIMIETVFAYPGLGQLFFRALGGILSVNQDADPGAITRMDYPLALSLMALLVIVVTLSNMLTDFFYTVADPRIDYRSKG
jgi:peptide/nickel transport system permease protein